MKSESSSLSSLILNKIFILPFLPWYYSVGNRKLVYMISNLRVEKSYISKLTNIKFLYPHTSGIFTVFDYHKYKQIFWFFQLKHTISSI